jgi:DNA polymerase III epsilon subunit-like protein
MIADIPPIEITVSHQIVSMTRGSTKNSSSPMWRCLTADGERVNIFKHADPAKNTFALFEAAGYAPALDAMVDGEERTWKQNPIFVTLARDGQWWNVIAVLPAVSPVPDPPARPDHRPYRNRAIMQAYTLTGLATAAIVFWDTETTGTGPDDEIISFGACNQFGERLYSTLIKPLDMSRVDHTSHIHGITPAMLTHAPLFPEVYPVIRRLLLHSLWVIYNADFDCRMLEQDCLRHNLELVSSVGVNCAMQLFAEFHGEWNYPRQHWQSKSLAYAAAYLQVPQPDAHDALADAQTTQALLEAIAAQPNAE